MRRMRLLVGELKPPLLNAGVQALVSETADITVVAEGVANELLLTTAKDLQADVVLCSVPPCEVPPVSNLLAALPETVLIGIEPNGTHVSFHMVNIGLTEILSITKALPGGSKDGTCMP